MLKSIYTVPIFHERKNKQKFPSWHLTLWTSWFNGRIVIWEEKISRFSVYPVIWHFDYPMLIPRMCLIRLFENTIEEQVSCLFHPVSPWASSYLNAVMSKKGMGWRETCTLENQKLTTFCIFTTFYHMHVYTYSQTQWHIALI